MTTNLNTDSGRIDPKGLIRESFRIEGIDASQCRSIFVDWALSLPDGVDNKDALQVLLDQYQVDNPDHPMTEVMRAGLTEMVAPKRRGGWRSRNRPEMQ